ncbi:hypothetical protein [Brevirhabdus sp.]|uniref:hypothetical protein n=1 Tax=Brevirhabdus sp. TaxID=2004514 RepID=UPI004059DF84
MTRHLGDGRTAWIGQEEHALPARGSPFRPPQKVAFLPPDVEYHQNVARRADDAPCDDVKAAVGIVHSATWEQESFDAVVADWEIARGFELS